MKLSNIICMGLIFFCLGLLPNMAKSVESEQEILLSQFNLDLDIELPTNKKTEAEPVTEDFIGFSGKYAEYKDTFNGFKLEVPVEFTKEDQGKTTTWVGPRINNFATTISLNTTFLSAVKSENLQKTYQVQYEQDAFYTDVRPFKVKFEDEMVPALRLREVNQRQDSRQEKDPHDVHRWHLFIFGNERVYSMTMSAAFATFQDNQVQSIYENTISSVELIPIEE